MRERLLSVNPTEIVFAQASPEQQKQTWELNGVSWALPMEIPDYVEREAYLSNQDLTRDGGCKYWILHLQDRPDDIIASCECTRKTLIMRRPGDSQARESTGYSIASVYTNPAYRRLGMASLMLLRLQEEMDKDSDASALYSDIGRQYYAQLGWAVFPSEQATLELLPRDSSGSLSFPVPNGGTRYLTTEDLRPLCQLDVADLKAKLEAMEPDGKMHVAFAPSYEQIAWQFAREDFVTRVMHKKQVERRGAITEDEQSWIIWDHDWREEKLKIQRITTLHTTSAEQRIADITALLEAAMHEAASWGLPKVLVWNPDEITTLGVKGVGNAHEEDVKIIFDERLDSSIPSLRLKGGKDISRVVWEDNEYYAWA